jgi:hypothetical protein
MKGANMAQIDQGEDEDEYEDDEIEAHTYSIGYSIPDNEMRIQFHNEFGTLSSFVMSAADGYDFAQRVLKAYDKLEGL